MPKVTISLVTYNSEEYLRDFCVSLKEQTYADWELMVVDNASHDRSAALIHEWFPNARCIQQKENLGFSRAHNLTCMWSKSEYVLVVNPDIFFEPHCIERLVRYLDRFESVASVGPKLLGWDHAQFAPTGLVDSCGIQMTPAYRARDRFQGERDRDLPSGRVFGISGACVMYRRDALEEVKIPRAREAGYEYFDEDFFAYKEDVDLAWRLNLAGFEQHLVADATAFHQRTISGVGATRAIRKKRSAINRYSYRNHILMVIKNHQWSLTIRHLLPFLVFEVQKYVYLAILDGSSIRGFGEVMRNMRVFVRKRSIRKQQTRVKPAVIASLLHY